MEPMTAPPTNVNPNQPPGPSASAYAQGMGQRRRRPRDPYAPPDLYQYNQRGGGGPPRGAWGGGQRQLRPMPTGAPMAPEAPPAVNGTAHGMPPEPYGVRTDGYSGKNAPAPGGGQEGPMMGGIGAGGGQAPATAGPQMIPAPGASGPYGPVGQFTDPGGQSGMTGGGSQFQLSSPPVPAPASDTAALFARLIEALKAGRV